MSSSEKNVSGRGQAGFSILECIIALSILMAVLVSVSSLMATAFKVGANSRYEQAATEIAASTLDSQIQTGATTLLGEVGDAALPTVTSGGQGYALEREVAPYVPGSLGCVSPTSNGEAMLKVIIWATWANVSSSAHWWIPGNAAYTGLQVEETSLVAVPAADINTSLGSVLVTIEGAAGNGIQDLTVTATPQSPLTGSALVATTTQSGCALFANIAVGNWAITFSCPSGYIYEQNSTTCLPPTAEILSVSGDNTSSLQFVPTTNNAYDQAATVTASYSAPTVNGAQPLIPSNVNALPLSLYNAYLTTSPYVTTATASVFPFATSPSYNVVAGSCGAESAPDGGTVDGAPVALTPGGQATAAISLVPIEVQVDQSTTIVSGAAVTASVASATGGTDPNCPTVGTPTAMPTLKLGTTCTGGGCILSAFRSGHQRQFILVSNCTSSCGTSTTLSTTTSATYGSPVTFTATVTCTGTGCSPVNAGTVTFRNTTTSTVLGTGTVNSSGVATSPAISSLPVGNSSITATYNGSGKWLASAASSAKTQTITAAGTSTALASNPNPSAYGASAILTATVTAASPSTATPTGTINFTSGGTTITGCGAVTLASGQASCTLAGSGSGPFTLVAVYTPSTSPTNFTTSTSSTLTQTVTAASTTTALTSSANPSPQGSALVLTATVTDSPSTAVPVGTVVFKDGATTLGSVAVNASGLAVYTTSTLALGSHSLTAVFTPTNSSLFGSSTGALTQVVGGSYYVLGSLPYGVWMLNATYSTYSSANETTQVVVTVNANGVSLNGGASYITAGTPVVVQIK